MMEACTFFSDDGQRIPVVIRRSGEREMIPYSSGGGGSDPSVVGGGDDFLCQQNNGNVEFEVVIPADGGTASAYAALNNTDQQIFDPFFCDLDCLYRKEETVSSTPSVDTPFSGPLEEDKKPAQEDASQPDSITEETSYPGFSWRRDGEAELVTPPPTTKEPPPNKVVGQFTPESFQQQRDPTPTLVLVSGNESKKEQTSTATGGTGTAQQVPMVQQNFSGVPTSSGGSVKMTGGGAMQLGPSPFSYREASPYHHQRPPPFPPFIPRNNCVIPEPSNHPPSLLPVKFEFLNGTMQLVHVPIAPSMIAYQQQRPIPYIVVGPGNGNAIRTTYPYPPSIPPQLLVPTIPTPSSVSVSGTPPQVTPTSIFQVPPPTSTQPASILEDSTPGGNKTPRKPRKKKSDVNKVITTPSFEPTPPVPMSVPAKTKVPKVRRPRQPKKEASQNVMQTVTSSTSSSTPQAPSDPSPSYQIPTAPPTLMAPGALRKCVVCLAMQPATMDIFKPGLEGVSPPEIHERMRDLLNPLEIPLGGAPSEVGVCRSCLDTLEQWSRFRSAVSHRHLAVADLNNDSSNNPLPDLQETKQPEVEGQEGSSKVLAPPKTIPCDECGKKFFRQGSLINHRNKHHRDKNVCNKCGKKFRGWGSVMKHLTRCENNGRGTSKNSGVKKGPKKRKVPFTVVRAEPEPVLPFQCEVCGKRYKQTLSFQVHSAFHSDVNSRKCAFCDTEILDAPTYRKHTRTHKKEQDMPIILEPKIAVRKGRKRKNVDEGEPQEKGVDKKAKLTKKTKGTKKLKKTKEINTTPMKPKSSSDGPQPASTAPVVISCPSLSPQPFISSAASPATGQENQVPPGTDSDDSDTTNVNVTFEIHPDHADQLPNFREQLLSKMSQIY